MDKVHRTKTFEVVSNYSTKPSNKTYADYQKRFAASGYMFALSLIQQNVSPTCLIQVLNFVLQRLPIYSVFQTVVPLVKSKTLQMALIEYLERSYMDTVSELVYGEEDPILPTLKERMLQIIDVHNSISELCRSLSPNTIELRKKSKLNHVLYGQNDLTLEQIALLDKNTLSNYRNHVALLKKESEMKKELIEKLLDNLPRFTALRPVIEWFRYIYDQERGTELLGPQGLLCINLVSDSFLWIATLFNSRGDLSNHRSVTKAYMGFAEDVTNAVFTLLYLCNSSNTTIPVDRFDKVRCVNIDESEPWFKGLHNLASMVLKGTKYQECFEVMDQVRHRIVPYWLHEYRYHVYQVNNDVELGYDRITKQDTGLFASYGLFLQQTTSVDTVNEDALRIWLQSEYSNSQNGYPVSRRHDTARPDVFMLRATLNMMNSILFNSYTASIASPPLDNAIKKYLEGVGSGKIARETAISYANQLLQKNKSTFSSVTDIRGILYNTKKQTLKELPEIEAALVEAIVPLIYIKR